MIPPAIMQLRIRDEYGKGFGLWLPLFILWPIGLVCFLFVLPFLIIAEVVLTLVGDRFHPLIALLGICGVMSAMRGLNVNVDSKQSNKSVRILIV